MWQNELEFRRCFPEFAKVFQSVREVFQRRHWAFLLERPVGVASRRWAATDEFDRLNGGNRPTAEVPELHTFDATPILRMTASA